MLHLMNELRLFIESAICVQECWLAEGDDTSLIQL